MATKDFARIENPTTRGLRAELERARVDRRDMATLAESSLKKAIDWLAVAETIAKDAIAGGHVFKPEDAAALVMLPAQRTELESLLSQARVIARGQ